MTASRRPRDPSPPRVLAGTFPPRHTIHKYWGKKPANVVAAYLRRYALQGAPVLDPFSGSGIVLSEALVQHRTVIAADINPIANLIARVTVDAVDPDSLALAGQRILAALADLRRSLYAVRCTACRSMGEVIATAFDGDHPVRVTVDCPRCGVMQQAPTRARSTVTLPSPGDFPDDDIVVGWQMQKLHRAGARRWSDLFTPRNLVAVSHLRRAVESEALPTLRRALRVSFTAHLAQATRMIADYPEAAGGPSWKLNSYWLPPRSQELNAFRYFANRVAKTARGVADMRAALGRSVTEGVDYHLHELSAEALATRIAPASVGYVFTDPPYGGEGIQYGELSTLWNLWSGAPTALRHEINANPFQQKSPEHYARRLGEAFAAIDTVLAPEGWMSVTFANKDSTVWDALLTACRRAGFTLRWAVPMSQSAANVTNKVTRAAPKTDLVVTFRKRSLRRAVTPRITTFALETCAREEALALASVGTAFRTSALYDRLLMRWMKHEAPPDDSPRPRFTLTQVADFLSRSTDFVPVIVGHGATSDAAWTAARANAP